MKPHTVYQNVPAHAKEGIFKEAEAKLPLKRVGKPEEVAEAVSTVQFLFCSRSLLTLYSTYLR
jgi:NAD(P)-dependent dehydrogenase (short-subunit alcohol dehydrogenase family)